MKRYAPYTYEEGFQSPKNHCFSYTSLAQSSYNNDELLDTNEADHLRRDYLEQIVKLDAEYRAKAIAKTISDALSEKYTPSEDGVSFDDGPIITKHVITIGTLPWCDVWLPKSRGGSRCHCTVFVFKEAIVLVDIGSYYGVVTKKLSSLPNARRALTFTEPVIQAQFGTVHMKIARVQKSSLSSSSPSLSSSDDDPTFSC